MTNLPKLVVVLSRFPFPLEKGDKLRSYYQIKELSKRFSIHLIALSDVPVKQTSVEELKKYCDTVTVYKLSKLSIVFNSLLSLLGNKPVQVGYFYNYIIHYYIKKQLKNIRPDHIFTQLIRTTEYTKNYHQCPKTLDYMDALSKGMERRINNAKWYTKWFFKTEYKRLLAYERIMFDYFDKKTIISEQDKRYIFHPERDKIICIPNGIDAHFMEELSVDKQYDISFVGNMNYSPNVEAVLFIANNILPSFPELKLLVAGATPHPKLEKLAKQNSQITISGWVDDIRTAYASSKIFFAPMQTGTGMQNKLLEAMALGIPCITTSLANNPIGTIHNKSILVCDSVEEMKSGLKQLLDNSAERERIGSAGREFIKERYSWEKTTRELI
jgi:glycosyltransferase involved in cell wall biosynthesis